MRLEADILASLNGAGASSAKVLNVAIIGVGEVAMTTHLPTLLLCSHMYKTVAVVDVSKQALAHCSTKFHVPAAYTDVGEMLQESPEVDVVFILNANEYHAIHAIQCLKAGKHVFIEKPMAISKRDADAIEAARKESGKVVFVGYMRRYAAAFLRLKELLQNIDSKDINYVRVRDIIGLNEFFVDQGGNFPLKFTDFPSESVQERGKLGNEILSEAIGVKSQNSLDRLSWSLLNGLASHDMSAMRELIGMPRKVLCATRSSDGLFMTTTFQYENFTCYYEMGIDRVKKFDAHIEIYTKKQHLKVTYDTPYIKGLPITTTILSTKPNGDFSEEVIRPTYEDPYTLEYKELYQAITAGKEVKTTAVDAKEDLEIFEMIMGAL